MTIGMLAAAGEGSLLRNNAHPKKVQRRAVGPKIHWGAIRRMDATAGGPPPPEQPDCDAFLKTFASRFQEIFEIYSEESLEEYACNDIARDEIYGMSHDLGRYLLNRFGDRASCIEEAYPDSNLVRLEHGDLAERERVVKILSSEESCLEELDAEIEAMIYAGDRRGRELIELNELNDSGRFPLLLLIGFLRV
eukprot:CAMPEP_0113566186 /NCGR_PEP_ID=MMETSP0015_2-20120614/22587_1 /TAXON_ID=2838 /ORGANISM="Odontella" /LENGTH=192 /DNA_ID=CAMNT_0000468455 /DNA_START=160 /DNA_END=738 /DNA_ORIENTATION=+ /assembly_acc=CAM_ASM_000160